MILWLCGGRVGVMFGYLVVWLGVVRFFVVIVRFLRMLGRFVFGCLLFMRLLLL